MQLLPPWWPGKDVPRVVSKFLKTLQEAETFRNSRFKAFIAGGGCRFFTQGATEAPLTADFVTIRREHQQDTVISIKSASSIICVTFSTRSASPHHEHHLGRLFQHSPQHGPTRSQHHEHQLKDFRQQQTGRPACIIWAFFSTSQPGPQPAPSIMSISWDIFLQRQIGRQTS